MKINSKKKLKSWISTARLETIPLSISGIIIGSFYSFFLQKFDILIFILALLTAISYQILSNFANDYGDGILGTDDNRIGPKMSPLKLTDRRSNQPLLQCLAKLDLSFDTKSTHHILTVNQEVRSNKDR